MQVIELPFTTLEIYDDYVVGRTKTGVHMTMGEHQQVLEVLNQYLASPYGFIVDEVNSYSVDFHVMQHISKDENICCIGVVYYRPTTKIALGIGQFMIDKPIHFSKSINDVTNWVKDQVTY